MTAPKVEHLPGCLGQYEADDSVCNGEPDGKDAVERAPCMLRDHCAALVIYTSEHDERVSTMLANLGKDGVLRHADEIVTSLSIVDGVPKDEREDEPEPDSADLDDPRFLSPEEGGTGPKGPPREPGVMGRHPTYRHVVRAYEAHGVKGVRALRPQPTRYASLKAIRHMRAQGKDVDDLDWWCLHTFRPGYANLSTFSTAGPYQPSIDLWQQHCWFVHRVVDELRLPFTPPGQAPRPGEVYDREHVSTSKYVRLYMLAPSGHDQPVCEVRFKRKTLEVGFPVTLDVLKANVGPSTLSKLSLREVRSAPPFFVKAKGLWRTGLGYSAQILGRLHKRGALNLDVRREKAWDSTATA